MSVHDLSTMSIDELIAVGLIFLIVYMFKLFCNRSIEKDNEYCKSKRLLKQQILLLIFEFKKMLLEERCEISSDLSEALFNVLVDLDAESAKDITQLVLQDKRMVISDLGMIISVLERELRSLNNEVIIFGWNLSKGVFREFFICFIRPAVYTLGFIYIISLVYTIVVAVHSVDKTTFYILMIGFSYGVLILVLLIAFLKNKAFFKERKRLVVLGISLVFYLVSIICMKYISFAYVVSVIGMFVVMYSVYI